MTILKIGWVEWSKLTDTLSHPSSHIAFLCLLACITPAVSSNTNDTITLAEGLINSPTRGGVAEKGMSRWEGKKGMKLLKLTSHQQNPYVKPWSQRWWVAALLLLIVVFSGRDSTDGGGGRGIWGVLGWKGFMFVQAVMLWILCGFSGKGPLPKAAALQHQQHSIPLYLPLNNESKWADWQIEHGKMDNMGMLRSSEIGGCFCDWDSNQSF